MPREGYKSITLFEEDYNYFMNLYEDQKDELRKKGVRSFSAFVTRKLYEAVELDEQRTPE